MRDHDEKDLIEEVKKTDEYENADKFGNGKVSCTFRIIYRSCEKTLTNEEVNKIQEKIISALEQDKQWQVRK